MDSQIRIQTRSAAEWIKINKHFVLVDGMSLYMTIKELVENSLDATTELIDELPSIKVTVEALDDSICFNSRKRKYVESDSDYESPKDNEAKRKRGKKKTSAKSNNDQDHVVYKVTCKDNGCGISYEDIPKLLGKVLCGTNYGLKQARGKHGIGAKMALIWADRTTGMPLKISTSQKGQEYTSVYKLKMDINRNEPITESSVKDYEREPWHGTEIELVMLGNWPKNHDIIVRYMSRIAMITPYAEFTFKCKPLAQDEGEKLHFRRRSTFMPSAPLEMKYHPSQGDMDFLKELVKNNHEKGLLKFLQEDFDGIGSEHARKFIKHLGYKVNTLLKTLNTKDIGTMNLLFSKAKYPDPSGNCLRPVDEYNLYMGISRELKTDMVGTYTSCAKRCGGHPFVVEAAVSIGGKDAKPGLHIYRFANRVPLMLDESTDIITKTANRFRWADYNIDLEKDQVGLFLSIVGTNIPFKDMTKESIRVSHVIKLAIEKTLGECCNQLKPLIRKQIDLHEQQEKENAYKKYSGVIASSIYHVLHDVSKNRDGPVSVAITKSDRNKEISNKVLNGTLTEVSLKNNLELYAKTVACGNESGTINKGQKIYLQSLDQQQNFIELESPSFVFRLFT